jgi:hypothetical protein
LLLSYSPRLSSSLKFSSPLLSSQCHHGSSQQSRRFSFRSSRLARWPSIANWDTLQPLFSSRSNYTKHSSVQALAWTQCWTSSSPGLTTPRCPCVWLSYRLAFVCAGCSWTCSCILARLGRRTLEILCCMSNRKWMLAAVDRVTHCQSRNVSGIQTSRPVSSSL